MDIFKDSGCNDLVQLILAFTLGILLSPWSYGLLYFLLFLIAYEIVLVYMTEAQVPYWRIETRLGVIAASILGFIIGRVLVGFPDHGLTHKPKRNKQKRV